MNKKGFTLVEILAAITILGILSLMAIAGYTRYIDYSKNKSYKHMAKSASTAAEEYIMDHPGDAVKTKKVNSSNGKKYVISNSGADGVLFETLIEEGYLSGASDPDNKGHDCKGRVTIGIIDGSSQGALDQYMYVVDQCCINYSAKYTYTIEVNASGETTTLEEVSKTNIKCDNNH